MKTDRTLAEKLLSGAKAGGAELSEVFISAQKALSVEAKDSEVDAVETSRGIGYCLRVIKDQRPGFSWSNSPDDWSDVVKNALETSRWTERDEFLGLPGPVEPRSVDIFDPRIDALDKQEAMQMAIEVERGAVNEDVKIRRVRKAEASFRTSNTLIANSKGVLFEYPSTSASAHVMTVSEADGDSQMGWHFSGSRFLKDIDFHGVGTIAAQKALKLLGARKISAIKAPVLLDASVAADFLGLFSSLLSAENAQKGKSLLAGKLGKKVLDSDVDIIDDGLYPGGLLSVPVDDEGVATFKKSLIRSGVLETFMHNTYTARKDGMSSTANGRRAGASSTASVGPTSFYITSPGTVGADTLFQSMGTGLYVMEAMGIHMANMVSGEFSIGVSGLWIENGSIAHPVREAVISGNILEFFSGINLLGDDLTFYGSTGAPSMLFAPVDISA